MAETVHEKEDKELIKGGSEYNESENELNLDDIKDRELEDAEKDTEKPTEHKATQDEERELSKKTVQKQGLRKELEDRVSRSLKRTKMVEKGKEHQVKPKKGQNQLMETEERDLEEDDTDDTVNVTENEQEEVLVLPMQPMALEVAREAMERRDELKREQDRVEEEQEDEE